MFGARGAALRLSLKQSVSTVKRNQPHQKIHGVSEKGKLP